MQKYYDYDYDYDGKNKIHARYMSVVRGFHYGNKNGFWLVSKLNVKKGAPRTQHKVGKLDKFCIICEIIALLPI